MIPVMIVPVLNRHDLLDRMIRSINYPIKDLVIINNGAKQYNYLPVWNQWINKIWHLQMPSNLGVATSWNLGIKATPMTDFWLITNSDVEWGGDSLKMFYEQSEPHKLLLSNGSPEWCAFTIGWKVVKEIGLFDEALHPAYFEDNDYERRISQNTNVILEKSFIPIAHDNSSTIKNGYKEMNNITFQKNQEYYRNKIEKQDMTDGQWQIQIRRTNSWD
jgi:GT2 family glycosyltransferase